MNCHRNHSFFLYRGLSGCFLAIPKDEFQTGVSFLRYVAVHDHGRLKEFIKEGVGRWIHLTICARV